MVARTRRSPGFGTPLAFPVSQWHREWRPGPQGPGTRYSGGAAPDLHRLPSIPVRVVSVFSSAASLSVRASHRKRRLESRFEAGALGLIRGPFVSRSFAFPSQVFGIQRRNRVEELPG